MNHQNKFNNRLIWCNFIIQSIGPTEDKCIIPKPISITS